MSPFLVPVVAIPARNEAERLPALLAALDRQTPWSSPAQQLTVIIVVNNSDDQSIAVIQTLVPSLHNLDVHVIDTVFAPDVAHVGSARKLAMDRGAQLVNGIAGGVILTTDADAVPPQNWVVETLRAVEGGADLVGGRIIGNPAEEASLGAGFQRRAQKYAAFGALCDELASLVDPIAHDPWPRHQDHTGGSLAIRADIYAAVGGLPPLPFREDIGLVRQVVQAGYRLVHPLSVHVTVSARTQGRAPGGMADCVRSWVEDEKANRPILVEHPTSVESRLLMRARLRALEGLSLIDAQQRLGGIVCPAAGLTGTDAGAIARLIDAWAAKEIYAVGDTPVDIAIEALQCRINQLRGERDAA